MHAKSVLVHYLNQCIHCGKCMYIVQTLYRTLYNDQFGMKGVLIKY